MFDKMTPEVFTAFCAGVTLLAYITTLIIGGVVSIFRKIDRVQTTILADVTSKHNENNQRYEALKVLVIRHDTILDPEFNGNFGNRHHG